MSVFDPDEEVVKRVAQGDAGAARVLIDAYGDRLIAVAYRMVGRQDIAEEIVQEAFIKMLKNAHKWRFGQARFSSWLHRVTANLCYDRLRKASTRLEHMAGDNLPDIMDQQQGAEEELQQGERSTALKNALARLPERQKMALILCHFEDMSNAEAAEAMDVKITALESLLARAKRALRNDLALKQDLSEDPERALGEVI